MSSAKWIAGGLLPVQRVFFGLLVCLSVAGCSGQDDWQASTYPARGSVVINGEPPVNLIVTFHPVDASVDVRQSEPWGIVKEDGSYSLRTYEPDDGAPPGEYQVTLLWRNDLKVPDGKDRLGFAYSKPEQSQWRFTVKKGKNTFPPIELNDVKVAKETGRKPEKQSPERRR